MTKQPKTSWESSSSWYDDIVGQKGHYYHEHIIIPKLLSLLNVSKTKTPSILDLACGQGILARSIPKQVEYVGVDISPSLIKAAKSRSKNPSHKFFIGDVTKKLPFPIKKFSHIIIILALQNIEKPEMVLKNISDYLAPDGQLFLVLNHPCFRIPRQSSWGIDEKKKLQYRRIDSYISPMKIPIQTHPGKKEGQTWSFHHPLSDFSRWLHQENFVISLMEEWISDKTSSGAKARMENRARKEFPLFLALVCRKVSQESSL